jgi:hypothetical protein
MQKNYRNKVRAYHDGKITLEKLRETESALYGHFNHADTYGLEQKMFKHNQNLK